MTYQGWNRQPVIDPKCNLGLGSSVKAKRYTDDPKDRKEDTDDNYSCRGSISHVELDVSSVMRD